MRRPAAKRALLAAVAIAAAGTPASGAAQAQQPRGAVDAAAAPAGRASTAVRLGPGALFKECEACPGMVVIPPGEFRMGAPGGEAERPEGPVRTVRIPRAFAVGRYEITHGQYAAFVGATGHAYSRGCNMWDAEARKVTNFPGHDWRNPGYGRPPRENEPAACVSWNDAQAYVAWLRRKTGQPYRLLTEAEWEYVARAGSDAAFPWGDDPEQACRHANVYDASAADPSKPWAATRCSDGHAGVAPVASFPPNAFGLYDVIGNVWEWVEDCYRAPYPEDAPTDGSPLQVAAECDRRAVRGGSWASNVMRNRPAFRGRDPATLVTWIFGFRVARDLP